MDIITLSNTRAIDNHTITTNVYKEDRRFITMYRSKGLARSIPSLPNLPLYRLLHTTSSLSHPSFPAIFARGGTSNGLVIHRHHLPPQSQWESILAPAMGSPDPYGRQLNGMGSGISSTSKICVISPSTRPEVADVDFTFVQVGIRDGKLDLAGNCGNMLSVVGPVAWDEGVVKDGNRRVEGGEGRVRILNTNTGKVIHSRFKVGGEPARFKSKGEFEMTGVPGTASKISLEFLDPAGAKAGRGALPTRNVVDELVLGDGLKVKASLVDVSNPGVFVKLEDVGLSVETTPADVEGDAGLKERLEEIRQTGARMMGLDPEVQSVPKIVLVGTPSGADESSDIRCLALSMGQAHKAVPLTLALCLGTACGIDGTIPFMLRRQGQQENKKTGEKGTMVVIGHPSGSVEIGTTVKDGKVLSAELHRTARILIKGEVFY